MKKEFLQNNLRAEKSAHLFTYLFFFSPKKENHILKATQYLLFAILLFVQSISIAQNKTLKALDDYMNLYFVNKQVPSISAGLLKDTSIVWTNYKGIADLELNEPVQSVSLYRIASISKSITAVAIMQLWEKGSINLDENVRTYVPTFPEKRWKFTVRQLLNHTAGIRGYKEGEFDNKKYFSSTDEALKLFAYDSLLYEPGTKYNYTTLGYTLLAAVIENVSKMSFEDYLNSQIFIPAGMYNTLIDKQKQIIPQRVKGYVRDEFRKLQNAPLADLSIKVAGGGLLSNVNDLLLFSKALLTNKLVKSSTLEQMTRRTKLKNGQLINYGLGFSVNYEADSLTYFYHVGGGTGFVSLFTIFPKEKIAAVHLINLNDRNLDLPGIELVKIYENRTYDYPTKTISNFLMENYSFFGIQNTIYKLEDMLYRKNEEYDLSENEIMSFGDDLAELKKQQDALTFYKSLTKFFPNSFNLNVKLAETYLKDNNKGLALKHFRIARQIKPDDKGVNTMIEKLSKK